MSRPISEVLRESAAMHQHTARLLSAFPAESRFVVHPTILELERIEHELLDLAADLNPPAA